MNYPVGASHPVIKPPILLITCLVLCLGWVLPPAFARGPMHAIAMHGEPKYSSGFQYFDYVRPDAPKDGLLRLAVIGSFDSLNPYIIQGVPIRDHWLMFESLMARSFDEPFSLYAAIAESVEMAADRSWIIFHLNPKARFHDGSPITADDVLFSWRTLKAKGRPNMRAYYSKVVKAERRTARCVKFSFGAEANWELPLILGLMPVLSERYYSKVSFDKSTLEPPVGSGPYRIVAVDPGRSVTYRRDPDYWGWDLPVNAGRHNFETIRYDYYRDADIALEAFKAGEYDLRFERDAARWSTGYDHPAVRDELIRLEAIVHERPVGMLGLVFNTRQSQFGDARVRQALGYIFDSEWINRALYHGSYRRITSYFENSELAARDPIDAKEIALLRKYQDILPEEVFTTIYHPPATDGSGRLREQHRKALRLLAQAGWRIKQGELVETSSGQPMQFEIMLLEPRYERMLLPYIHNLQRLGIKARLRTVDSAQYENRLSSFDFDVIVYHWGQSLSPGNEQEIYWSSQAADTEGSRNYAGIKHPAVDDLVKRIAGARDREELVTAAHALDRVLLWGHYVIPLFYSKEDWLAYWRQLKHPEVAPIYGTTIDLWWSE
ncbi:MAG: extracellular solute-binding protein [Pseudomonadota bacterium]